MKTKEILRRVRVWAVCVASIVIGVPLLLFLGTKALVSREISAAKASNIPLEPNKLRRKQIDLTNNGAVAYQKAFELLKAVDEDHKRIPVGILAVNNQLLPGQLDREMALIGQYQSAL